MADPGYRSFAHRHHAYLARGHYSEQISRLQQAVGNERVYVVDADRFFADPNAEFQRLTQWLGLPAWCPDHVDRTNARPGDPLAADLRTRLENYFEPFDRALAIHLGRELSWRASARNR